MSPLKRRNVVIVQWFVRVNSYSGMIHSYVWIRLNSYIRTCECIIPLSQQDPCKCDACYSSFDCQMVSFVGLFLYVRVFFFDNMVVPQPLKPSSSNLQLWKTHVTHLIHATTHLNTSRHTHEQGIQHMYGLPRINETQLGIWWCLSFFLACPLSSFLRESRCRCQMLVDVGIRC